MRRITYKKEIWLFIVPLAILLTILFSSCSKEKIEQSQDVGKVFVRVQEVDNDNTTQSSNVNQVYVKN